jgi:hypothetical protein
MITSRIAVAFAAGALAVGILAGSAGTLVARDATAPQAVDWAAHLSQMSSMMSGSGGMMNGSGGMMNGQNGTDPGASAVPDGMQQHHVAASPTSNQ